MKFVKYNAAGNDFIVTKELLNKEEIIKFCHRNFGIGADGVIFVEAFEEAERLVNIRIFNSDGGEASMCANGTRSVAHFIADKYFHGITSLTMKTLSGIYRCDVKDGVVSLSMPREIIRQLTGASHLLAESEKEYFVNTGVPHAVYFVENVELIDLAKKAPFIRFHPSFSKGINVNVASFDPHLKNMIHMRSYERGVEAETLSCGTGVIATAFACQELYGFKDSIQIKTKGGILEVDIGEKYLTYGGKVFAIYDGETK